jgi:hypothetical protein
MDTLEFKKSDLLRRSGLDEPEDEDVWANQRGARAYTPTTGGLGTRTHE